ncbi:MAG: RNA methyltransferase [Thermomicrobiales bacterium]|nr:RNA methyltransferase [Thermomicrobiales bacterium]
MTDFITSASNPLAKRIRALADKRTRRREGCFVVEGQQPVWRAAESGWEIDTLVIAPEVITNHAANVMIQQLERDDVRIASVSADLFTRLSERDGPAGIMAIVRTRTIPLPMVGEGDLWVILHRIHNPGNLGTIIRTADATGCAGIVLCGDSTDPFDPVAVKASMGSIFNVPLAIEREFTNVRDWARAQGLRLVGTSGYAEADHWSFDWTPPVAILLGNEGDGLTDDLLASVDATVRIPMTGTAESLNLGVAASVLMYEARRGRIS